MPPTQSLFWLQSLNWATGSWKAAATVLFEIQAYSFALPGSCPTFDSFLITVTVCSFRKMEKCRWGNALYQAKDAYSSRTPCGRKFSWRAPTQSFICHALKHCYCRSLLNMERGLWRSLQGLSSGRLVHIFMGTRVGFEFWTKKKCWMERSRKLAVLSRTETWAFIQIKHLIYMSQMGT